ncbi:hypothetical protein CPB83DRAFT_900138 [Crepidotus variabilis]|uniref:Uncharacterized protein n=1 Tax=Crepidotus variabilis TaxID=179855 RepID=A0A9P6E3Q5_9AGAR|nr:hypothetical protein CPB83DRAFT_900138 [Crepidotus variabilis]
MPIDLPVPLCKGRWSEIGEPRENLLVRAARSFPGLFFALLIPQNHQEGAALTTLNGTLLQANSKSVPKSPTSNTATRGSTMEPALFDDSSDPPSKIASSNDEDWILTEETPRLLGDLEIPTLKLATLSTKGEDEKGKQKEEKPQGRTFEPLGILQTPPPRANNDNMLPTLATITEKSDDLEQPNKLDETLKPDPSWILKHPKQDESD